MNYPIVALFLVFPLFLNAQSSSQEGNKNSDWAAESLSYLYLDQSCETPSHTIDISTLKLVQEGQDYSLTPFKDAITNLIRNYSWPAFKDMDCTVPLSGQEAINTYYVVDTVTTFDPLTYEEKIIIYGNDLLASVEYFMIKQQWSFDESSNTFSASLVAIAPVVSIYEGIESTPVWYKPPGVKKGKYALANKKIAFATQLDCFIEEQQLKTQKSTLPGLKQTLISRFKAGALQGYDAKMKLIPQSEIEQIFLSADTIHTFDPVTYEEKFDIVNREFRATDIGAFKVKQNWYFDPQKKALYNKLEAVAPSVTITDKSGTLSHYLPLFFWRKM